ncbi:MAG: NAD(P)H-dependent oxidoreductase subunit E [Clostridiales bacterium]|nr:NAD(P)H-dependent oxidoreductase subunit E [Clostridiales bacterium]
MSNSSTESKCLCENETDQEKFERIGEVIDLLKGHEGSLIQILHAAQGIYGYLPTELQEYMAEKLGRPLSEINGVITFYSYFSTVKKGENTIRVCLGTACYVRGGKKILERLGELLGIGIGETTADGKFSLEVMRCMGACGLAPAMTINGKVFKQVNPDKLKKILEMYY